MTDTSPPPKTSVQYSDCGSQTIQTHCLIIPRSGDGDAALPSETTRPPGSSVYRMLSSTEELDKVLRGVVFRHSSRAAICYSGRESPLAEIPHDVAAIENLINGDPRKTLEETVVQKEMSSRPGFSQKSAYLEKIKSFLEQCEEMTGGM